ALRPTRLSIHPGEVLALLGPSGCGKTTLLRLVAGLESADAGGRILFSRQDVTTLAAEQRRIGMVFQSYALFPQMSVEANIGYGLKVQKLDAATRRQRVGELIDLVRLNGMERKRQADVAGGQRQRLALARAVAGRPRVILRDVPMAALDAKLKEALRDELAELLRRLGITTIHVTHDQQEALAIADRLAVMHSGRIVQVGQGEDLYHRPEHPFVAQFLGRVNVLERDDAASREGLVRVAGLTLPCPHALLDQSQLLLRPEDIHLEAAAPGSHGHARVRRRIFLGDRVQLHLSAGNEDGIRVEHAGLSPFREGDAVMLRVDPDRLMPAREA